MVGPILRVIFGGESLHWSPLLTSILGPPPSLEEVRKQLPWLIALTAMIKASSFFGERVIRGHLIRCLGRRLRRLILSWAIDLRLDERLAVGQGEIQHRLTVDVERVERWLDKGGASLFRDGLTTLSLLLSMILLSGYLGLVTLLIYPLLITPILLLNKRLKQAARGEISTAHSLHLWSKYTEDHLTTITANQRERDLHTGLERYHTYLEGAQSRLALLQGVAPSLTELMVSLLIASSLFGFTYGLDQHWWSAEELLSLFVCIIMLYQPIKSLGQAQQQWAQGHVAIERCLSFKVTAHAPLSSDTRSYEDCGNTKYSLHTLKLQIFSIYRHDHILHFNLQHELSRGDLISVSGPNGCGKSSLLFAIARLLNVSGYISYLDEKGEPIDHDKVDVRWLGLPTQLTHKNIERYLLSSLDSSSESPPFDELNELLTRFSFPQTRLQASLAEAIDRSPSALPIDTTLKLWDVFESLSLGERQKLGLVSVLHASHGGLLLLDEPESHLDELSRRILIKTLISRAMDTLIVVATHDRALIEASTYHIKLSEQLSTLGGPK